MSKLSELLNPAPTSTSQPSPTTAQPAQVQPLVIDGQDHRTSSFSHASPSHTRFPSLTSPGLDALADVASNTAPLRSPTTHRHSNSFGSYQPSYERYGSRPASNHTLPPLSDGFTNSGGHQQVGQSSGLGQYHHRGIEERRAEGIPGPATTLPPLQRSPTEQQYSSVFEQLSEASKHVNNGPQDSLTYPSEPPQQVNSTHDLDMPDAPATTQIRQPSPGASFQSTNLPNAQSEQVEVKAEITENPSTTSQIENQMKEAPGAISAQSFTTMGSPAPKNMNDINKDGSHTPSPRPAENSTAAPPSKPKPEKTNKKRPAPVSNNKKGTASTVKRSHKKRKIEPDGGENTPSAQRTGTPVTSRTSITPALQNRKQGSVTPARSSSVAQGEDGESEDDNANYCICRKPDDHNLMIGCDGPCGDWYHTKCVNMEGGKHKLISVWYCPLCAEKGYETLWKRMCRLEGCQEPARSDTDPKSKYCSDEHGAEFMRRRTGVQLLEQKKPDGPRSHKKKRHDNYTDNFGNAGDGAADESISIHGGRIRAEDLKAMTEAVKDVQSFHRLGDGVLSPPITASPEGEDVKMGNGVDNTRDRITYTTEEEAQLYEITKKRTTCRERKKMLDDRDRFISAITARAKSVLAELKEKDKSMKDICGYDSRLSWSDQEFNQWRTSPEGQKALARGGVLSAPILTEHREPRNEDEEEEVGKGICKKKRCGRHQLWLKLAQQENLFEKDQARQEMKRLEGEEKGVKDRALIRSLELGEGVGA